MHVFDEVLCSLWSPDIQKMYSMLFMPEVIILNKIKFATSFLSVLNWTKHSKENVWDTHNRCNMRNMKYVQVC